MAASSSSGLSILPDVIEVSDEQLGAVGQEQTSAPAEVVDSQPLRPILKKDDIEERCVDRGASGCHLLPLRR